MKDETNRADLIAAMTEDLAPVKRVKPRDGLLLIGFSAIVAFAVSVFLYDFWMGMVTGEASGYFWITHGLLFVVGLASSAALVAQAQPRIGSRATAPAWGAAMLAIVPVAAVLTLLSTREETVYSGLNDPAAWFCTSASLVAGLLVAIASILWLRRGAPVSLERAGWLTGLAAGSLGTLAYGVTCPLDNLGHVGIWHVAPVAISAVIGRFVVPPLIRW
ncbi:NrsF family protein [Erythrobacter sp. THAF29]|uniref:NrsF family protein n=1 Tax=Erythrobacter sp. THAF29 TaxID=2587851 RepID=UPI00126785B0|nr:DUF1109 domain-containing protein [Erythrobacter sp. THAF29]QFT78926.1 hypothetical protein FIU90_15365 [Erythrobacter sp. THAF29]